MRFGAEMFRNKHAAIRPAVRAMSDTGLVTGSKPNVSAVEPELPPSRSRERATDLAVTGAVLVISLPTMATHDGRREILALNALLSLALVAPLLVRRRWPLPVFGCTAAVAFVTWFLDIPLTADVAILVAFYTVAAHESRRRTLGAAAVVLIGIAMAVVRWTPPKESLWVMAGFLVATAAAAGILGVNAQTRRRYLASVLERAQRLEFENEQREQLAAAAERSRIAREMHDIVAHDLTVIVALATGSVVGATTDPDGSLRAMEQVAQTGRHALADMRRVLSVLEPDSSNSDLTPQPRLDEIANLIAGVESAGLSTKLTINGDPGVADDALQLAVYRIVQEALTNVLRHATPGCTASVRLSFADDLVIVEVANTGDPNVESITADHAGRGLRGMRERVAMYSGTLDAGAPSEGGWKVVATLVPSASAEVVTP